MQLRRLAALERQKIIDEADRARDRRSPSIKAILADARAPAHDHLRRARRDRGEASATSAAPQILPGFDGDMSVEDLIPEEEMVVTVTRGGYIKRTRSDNYRSQHRGGKGVKGAQLRADDVVEHFFVTTTHHWLLFFTNKGRVYRAKAYEIHEAGRDAKGQHVANLLALQPDEEIAADPRHPRLRGRDVPRARHPRRAREEDARSTEYDTNRSGGVIAIKLREERRGRVARCSSTRATRSCSSAGKGMSLRFTATDEALRPMGRSTSGVKGMSFRSRGQPARSASPFGRRGRARYRFV